MASTRLPSPKSLVSAPTQILAQFPKQHQQSPKQQLQQVQQQTQQPMAQPSSVSQQQQPQQSPLPPGIKPTIQIKQESGNWKNAGGCCFITRGLEGFVVFVFVVLLVFVSIGFYYGLEIFSVVFQLALSSCEENKLKSCFS